jgi:hypothetical protein
MPLDDIEEEDARRCHVTDQTRSPHDVKSYMNCQQSCDSSAK